MDLGLAGAALGRESWPLSRSLWGLPVRSDAYGLPLPCRLPLFLTSGGGVGELPEALLPRLWDALEVMDTVEVLRTIL